MLVFVSIGEHIAGQLEAIQQEERRLAIENNLQIIPSSQYHSLDLYPLTQMKNWINDLKFFYIYIYK